MHSAVFMDQEIVMALVPLPTYIRLDMVPASLVCQQHVYNMYLGPGSDIECWVSFFLSISRNRPSGLYAYVQAHSPN